MYVYLSGINIMRWWKKPDLKKFKRGIVYTEIFLISNYWVMCKKWIISKAKQPNLFYYWVWAKIEIFFPLFLTVSGFFSLLFQYYFCIRYVMSIIFIYYLKFRASILLYTYFKLCIIVSIFALLLLSYFPLCFFMYHHFLVWIFTFFSASSTLHSHNFSSSIFNFSILVYFL